MTWLVGAARTDTGLKRNENQDSFFLDESLSLFLVADGMGGAASGQLAGRLVAETVAEYVRRYVDETPEDDLRYDFYDDALSPKANTVLQAVHLANSLLYDASHKEDENKGMGSTLAALLLDEEHVLVVHVGDSRVMRFREGRLEKLTVDHRVSEDPEFRNLVNPEATVITQMGHTLTRAMGVRERVKPDLDRLPVEPGDLFLLCSDGLSDMVEPALIEKVLAMDKSLEKKAGLLVDMALAGGGRDNVTVVLVEVVSGRIKGLLKKITGD
ncbi:MAG: protein phosphatase 2C domain-containing protein [Thermodesulfobacteriota bacterium]